MTTPHPYQLEYLSDIREGWTLIRDGKPVTKQLVVSPTGSGKTNLFCWTAEEFVKHGERCLILVDQDELVWQPIHRLRDLTGIIAYPEKAEHRAPRDAKVVVATVQSMAGRLGQYPSDAFGLVIADEADKSISPQWQTVLKHFDSAKVCGFTATPHRTDKRNLGEYYENAIERENLFSLINKGFLSPVTIQMLPIKLDLSGRGNGKDFTDAEADEIIGPHLEEIARSIWTHCAFRRTLVFLPLIKTCERFNDIARDLGLASDFVYGQDPSRDEKLKAFKRGNFDVLANSMLLTRGVDIPQVDCIVPCRPTKSVTLYFQMVGRGTRLADGKSDCLLLDFLYQASKKMVCRPAHLIAKNDEEVEQITALAMDKATGMPADIAMQMDLQTLAGDATAARHEALRKKLEEQRNKKATVISAADFAMKHGNIDAAEFEPSMFWEMGNVSPKQERYLKEAKIDVSTVHGTAHASKLLDIYFKNKPLRLAGSGVLAAINRSGYTRGIAVSVGITDFSTVTHEQGRKFFAALNGKRKEQIPA